MDIKKLLFIILASTLSIVTNANDSDNRGPLGSEERKSSERPNNISSQGPTGLHHAKYEAVIREQIKAIREREEEVHRKI